MQEAPKKIGFNARPFCQDGMRGLSRHTLELIKNLKKLHPEVEVYLYAYDEISSFYKKELPYAHFRDKKIRPKLLWDLFYLGIEVKRDRIDVFHSTNNLGIPFFFSRRIPIFVTIHDHFTHSARIGWGRSLKDWWASLNYRIEFFLLKRAKGFFTVSSSAREDIAKIMGLPLHLITVAYNGVDMEKSSVPIIPDDFYLYVGGLEGRKNIQTMLEGFKAFVEESNLQTKLLIAGDPAHAPSKVKETLENHPALFFLTGKLTEDELTNLYQSAQALIFPSHEEGFGLPLVEAMTLDCPIIASDIKVFKEIAQGVAMFFPVNDSQALKNKLVELRSNPDLKARMIKSGQIRCKEFNWEKMASIVYSAYRL